MGVLNVTPDSFSDGADHPSTASAIAAGLRMVAEGATILDIGGESTRPGGQFVAPAEEQDRILPVIEGLRDAHVTLSVDTRNASTMAAALAAGVTIVNDVSALQHDPDAAAVVAHHGCPVILMHSRGTPQTMEGLAIYGDVLTEVSTELAQHVAAAEAAGIARSQIALDPGFGFAKSNQQNVALLRGFGQIAALGFPVVAGLSRKRFIGHLSGVTTPADRDAGSLAAALFALQSGANILRVHNVAATVQAVRVWQALAG